jgi:hypothetical protein
MTEPNTWETSRDARLKVATTNWDITPGTPPDDTCAKSLPRKASGTPVV